MNRSISAIATIAVAACFTVPAAATDPATSPPAQVDDAAGESPPPPELPSLRMEANLETGVVILSGRVTSEEVRAAAESGATTLVSFTRVENHIDVVAPGESSKTEVDGRLGAYDRSE